METVKLIIDRKPVEVPKGTTILDAAKGMGIRIPTLCYMKLEDLHYENNPGACRICVVEIEGRRNLAPSCKTECMEGLRGEATVKPPFPSEQGYKGCPTNVNNVETYANVPVILLILLTKRSMLASATVAGFPR